MMPRLRLDVVLFLGALVSSVGNAYPEPTALLNEVCPRPRDGAPWIELTIPDSWNGTQTLVLVTKSGSNNEPPSRVPLPSALPPGSMVLLELDRDVNRDLNRDDDDEITVEPTHSVGLSILHGPSSLTRLWAPSRGWLLLLSRSRGIPDIVLDAVAWGGPPDFGDLEVPQEVWDRSAFVPLYEHFGVYDTRTEVLEDDTIGRIPGVQARGAQAWARYRDPRGCAPEGEPPCETTRGGPNRVPRLDVFNLPTSARVPLGGVGLAWPSRSGVEEYRIEVARDSDFLDPSIDAHLTGAAVRIALTDLGSHRVRVARRVGHLWSAWSQTLEMIIEVTPCTCRLLGTTVAPELLGLLSCRETEPPSELHVVTSIRPSLRRKDTCMYCRQCPAYEIQQLSAGPLGAGVPWPPPRLSQARNRPELGDLSVITPASSVVLPSPLLARVMPVCRPLGSRCASATPYRGHGANYCVPASVSMVASAYGLCLSQDRIAYYLNAGCKESRGELSHGVIAAFSCGDSDFSSNECEHALAWALGWEEGATPYGNADSRLNLLDVLEPPPEGSTGWVLLWTMSQHEAEVKQWIDLDRPVMVNVGGHVHVVAGYCVEPGDHTTKLLIYDPMIGPTVWGFEGWDASMKRAWAAPSARADKGSRRTSATARSDDFEIWLDTDGEGLMDFDEIRRFASDATCSDSNQDGVSDLDDLLFNSASPLSWAPPEHWPYAGPP